MAQPDIWIGTIEISWSDEKTPKVFKPAFTVVTTWANSPEEFREKCVRMLENHGWKLLAACGKTRKYVIPNPVRFLNGVRNLLFPWLSCEQQIPHPQTTRVRDDKRAFLRGLSGNSNCAAPVRGF